MFTNQNHEYNNAGISYLMPVSSRQTQFTYFFVTEKMVIKVTLPVLPVLMEFVIRGE